MGLEAAGRPAMVTVGLPGLPPPLARPAPAAHRAAAGERQLQQLAPGVERRERRQQLLQGS